MAECLLKHVLRSNQSDLIWCFIYKYKAEDLRTASLQCITYVSTIRHIVDKNIQNSYNKTFIVGLHFSGSMCEVDAAL